MLDRLRTWLGCDCARLRTERDEWQETALDAARGLADATLRAESAERENAELRSLVGMLAVMHAPDRGRRVVT